MGFLTKLFEKGTLNPKQMVKILKKHEDRIEALESGSSSSGGASLPSDLPSYSQRISNLENGVGEIKAILRDNNLKLKD